MTKANVDLTTVDLTTVETKLIPGHCYLLMTNTTHYWMGRFVSADIWTINLVESAWIPQIGRHGTVLTTGQPTNETEVEPHAAELVARIPRSGTLILDWPWPLWRKQK